MKSIISFHNSLAAFLILSVGAAFSNGSPAAAQVSSSKPAYRFVNINKIVSGWDYARKLQDDLKAEFDRKLEAIQARTKSIQKMRDELAAASVGGATDESRRREKELALEIASLQYDSDQFKKERNEKQLRVLLAEYQQIQEIAGRWAEKNGVNAVFVVQDEDSKNDDLQGRYDRAVVRQVLWYSKDLDVTDDVLKLLQASSMTESRPANAAGDTHKTAGNK